MRWRRYVPVGERRRRAAREMDRMRRAGGEVEPIEIDGRRIARTFWGEAWCTNLERYGDYANRLPRGRTYVRNGSVIHLGIASGRVRSLVYGSELYEVEIGIEPLPATRWSSVKERCAGQIGSLVELLRGSISDGVMQVVTGPGEGLFPSPAEIALDCSCPDWAEMCKHVAAALYGVGARLDHAPELLFALRGVDPVEMVEAAVGPPAVAVGPAHSRSSRSGRALAAEDLSSVFGVDIDMGGPPAAAKPDPIAPAKANRKAKRKAKATRKTKPKSARKAKTKSAGKTKAPPKPKPTRKTKAKPTGKPTAKPKPTRKTKTKSARKAKAPPKPKPTRKTKAKPTGKPTAKPKTTSTRKTKPKTKPKTTSTRKTKPKTKATPKTTARRKAKASPKTTSTRKSAPRRRR